MEEGELEPEAAWTPGLDSDVADGNGVKLGAMGIADPTDILTVSDRRIGAGDVAAGESTGKEIHATDIAEERKDKEDEVLAHQSNNFVDGTSGSMRDGSETESDIVTTKHGSLSKGEVGSSRIHFVHMGGADIDVLCHGLSPKEEAAELDISMDVKFSKEGLEAQEVHPGNLENAGFLEHQLGLSGEQPKTVPVESDKSVSLVPANVADAGDDSVLVGKDSRGVMTSGNIDKEGPSTRGFQLFSSSPVRNTEKINSAAIEHRDDKTEMEPLDLSLSLPNVLLPIGAREEVCSHDLASGPTQKASWHPSPIQGVNWQALAQSEIKHNDPASYATISNGNSYLPQSQAQALKGNPNGQHPHGLDLRVLEGSSGVPNGLDRQLSFWQLSRGRAKHHDDGGKSPPQSDSSHERVGKGGFDWK